MSLPQTYNVLDVQCCANCANCITTMMPRYYCNLANGAWEDVCVEPVGVCDKWEKDE